MQKNPFFSFIIPVYNVENYLEECIESILNQSFNDYEIILIDDASTDSSLKICNYFKKKDNRVKVISKKNEGLAETRNRGLDISSGDYIIFLDSDDHIEKSGKILLSFYNLLKDKSIDVLFFHLTPFILNNDSTYKIYEVPFRKNIGATTDISIIFNKRLYIATACDKIVRRNLIVDNQIRFSKGLLSEDIKWCGDLLRSTKNILFQPAIFYYYRKNRLGSITYKTSEKNIRDIIFQLESHFSLINKSDKYVNEFYAFYYLSCLKQMIDHDEFSLNEIIRVMKPMALYLKLSNEKRIRIFSSIIRLLGFDAGVKMVMLLLRRK